MACVMWGRSERVRQRRREVMKVEVDLRSDFRIDRGEWRLASPSLDDGGGARGFVGVAVAGVGNEVWVNES